jgi:hypothetical protein
VVRDFGQEVAAEREEGYLIDRGLIGFGLAYLIIFMHVVVFVFAFVLSFQEFLLQIFAIQEVDLVSWLSC